MIGAAPGPGSTEVSEFARTVGVACDWAGALLLTAGALLCLTSAIGLVRFDEVYARMHAATKPQVLGTLCVLTGVGLCLRDPGIVGMLLLVAAAQMLTIPASAQLLARAHLRTRGRGHDDRARRVVSFTDSRHLTADPEPEWRDAAGVDARRG